MGEKPHFKIIHFKKNKIFKREVKGKWFSARSKSSSSGDSVGDDDDETSQSSSSRSGTSSETESHSYKKSRRSSSTHRMYSPDYCRRSAERTYYSPNYCPWSRSSSSESDDSKLSDRSIKTKSKAKVWKPVSNCRTIHTSAEKITLQKQYSRMDWNGVPSFPFQC